MNLSALLVVFNEEKRLGDCLRSLKLIEDVIVVDIGSTDSSAKIAKDMGFKVYKHPWVPVVEMVLPNMIYLLKNDWFIKVDPDEVLPINLIDDLLNLDVDEKVGIVQVPYQYYFLNKKLDTTIWGGVRFIQRIFHRDRVNVTADVHRALNCKPGYEQYKIPSRPGNAVIHYWIDNYQQLITKHERYIALEGMSRYNNGSHFSMRALITNPLKIFRHSFIECHGWRGGWVGWFLSFFIAFYEARALLSLRMYEKSISKKNLHHD